MTNHIVVAGHGRRIRRLASLSLLAFTGFLLAVDLPILWLLSSLDSFAGTGNITFLILLGSFIGGCGLFQLHRLSGDGGKVATLLGGTQVILNPGAAELRQFRNVATETAIAAAIPMPRLFVLNREQRINAFAAGTQKEGMAVCVSAGALKHLTRDELQGVVAHEMAHLRHGDVAISRLLAAGVFGLMCFTIVGMGMLYLAGVSGKADSKEGAGGLLLFAFAGLGVILVGAAGWLAAALLDASSSREMELRADADAVRMMSDSTGLVGALVKLGIEAKEFPPEAAGWLKPHNPMNFNASLKAYWFDTHPPLMDRIRALDPARAAELQTEMGG